MSFRSPFQQDFDARAKAFSQPAPDGGILSIQQAMQIQAQKVYDLEQPRYAGMPGLRPAARGRARRACCSAPTIWAPTSTRCATRLMS
jgi:hypothetical protein